MYFRIFESILVAIILNFIAIQSELILESSLIWSCGFLLRIYANMSKQNRLLLNLTGPYRFMRHPELTGLILITLSYLLHSNRIELYLLTAALFIFVIPLLSKQLDNQLGKYFLGNFQSIKREIPSLLPKLSPAQVGIYRENMAVETHTKHRFVNSLKLEIWAALFMIIFLFQNFWGPQYFYSLENLRIFSNSVIIVAIIIQSFNEINVLRSAKLFLIKG